MPLTPHPWSHGFEWTPRAGPFVRLSREQAEHYDAHGYVAIEGVLARDAIAELIARLDPQEARVDAWLRDRPEQRAFIADARAIKGSRSDECGRLGPRNLPTHERRAPGAHPCPLSR